VDVVAVVVVVLAFPSNPSFEIRGVFRIIIKKKRKIKGDEGERGQVGGGWGMKCSQKTIRNHCSQQGVLRQ